MNTDIGITEKNRKAVATQLSRLLADEFVLYTKTRKAHWNIEGKDFHTMHVFFESQYEQLDEVMDSVAERIRQRIVDGQSGDTEPGCGVAINHDLRAKTIVLLVRRDVLQLWDLLHGYHEFRRPLIQLRQVIAGQRVLIQAGGDPGANLELLRRLQHERRSGDPGRALADVAENDVRVVRMAPLNDGVGVKILH